MTSSSVLLEICKNARKFAVNYLHKALKQLLISYKPKLPAPLKYHLILLIKENEEKEMLTDFDDLFKLTGMDYML